MAGVSAFFNGATEHIFKAISESDEEGEALFSLQQARQASASGMPTNFDGLEPGDLVGQ